MGFWSSIKRGVKKAFSRPSAGSNKSGYSKAGQGIVSAVTPSPKKSAPAKKSTSSSNKSGYSKAGQGIVSAVTPSPKPSPAGKGTTPVTDPFFSIEGQKQRISHATETVGSSLLSPISGEKITANTGSPAMDNVLSFAASNPYTTALTGIGLKKAPSLIKQLSIGLKGGDVAIAKAASGTVPKIMATTTVGNFATNTVTGAKTLDLLKSIVIEIGGNPAIAGSIMTLIGTYPFAGFIKEEALQELNFAYKEAKYEDDIIGMQIALDYKKEILNPDIWKKLLSSIPFVNVYNELKDYYKAADLKMQQDEYTIQKMRITIEHGYFPSKLEERKRQEAEEYWNMVNEKREIARKEERAEDEKYWADILNKHQADEEIKSKEESKDFGEYLDSDEYDYEKYKKSKLKFGII